MRRRWGILFVALMTVGVMKISGGAGNLDEKKQNARQAESYSQGFKDGLSEHHQMLEEVRKELDTVRAELESVHRNNTYVTILSLAILPFLFGAGWFSARSFFEMNKAVSSARDSVEAARQEANQITAVRKALQSELYEYLKGSQVREGTLQPGSISPLVRAGIEENDHLTFLGNPFFRFRQPETPDEIDLYSQVLLKSARWHLAEGRYAEGLLRLNMLFALRNSPLAGENPNLMARAHSYKAYGFIGLLGMQERESVVTIEGLARRYRDVIEASLNAAKQLDPTWSLAHVWEGLYLSTCPDVPEGATAEQERSCQRKAQEEAIAVYRGIIQAASKVDPNALMAARLNLCCCLKRVGDLDKSYEALFIELQALPDEKSLRTQYGSVANEDNAVILAFWKRIMVDAVFFSDVSVDVGVYSRKWMQILDQKATVTKWREFYLRRIPRNLWMREWKVRLWECVPESEPAAGV